MSLILKSISGETFEIDLNHKITDKKNNTKTHKITSANKEESLVIKEHFLQDFYIVESRIKLKKGSILKSTINHPCVSFRIAKCCNFDLISDDEFAGAYTGFSANIWISNTYEGTIIAKENCFIDLCSIYISNSYFENMCNKHKGIFNNIHNRMKNENFKVFKNNIPVSKLLRQELDLLLSYNKYDEFKVLYVESKLIELISLLFQENKNCLNKKKINLCDLDIDKIISAHSIIENKYLNTINIDQIASNVGINKSYLQSGFKMLYKCTIGEHIKKKRMEKAYSYVNKTNKDMAEIAELVGYKHQSHFTTAFKRFYGNSPGVVRKLCTKVEHMCYIASIFAVTSIS